MIVKEIEISKWNEFLKENNYQGEPKVTIKKFNFGEMQDLQDEGANVQVAGRELSARVKFGQFKILSLVKGIVKAPFPINAATIRSFDNDLGEFLYKELDDLNRVEDIEKK